MATNYEIEHPIQGLHIAKIFYGHGHSVTNHTSGTNISDFEIVSGAYPL